jgi:hypothetical protein
MFCQRCGAKIESFRFCPHCGQQVPGESPPAAVAYSLPQSQSTWTAGRILAAALVVFIGVVFLIASVPGWFSGVHSGSRNGAQSKSPASRIANARRALSQERIPTSELASAVLEIKDVPSSAPEFPEAQDLRIALEARMREQQLAHAELRKAEAERRDKELAALLKRVSKKYEAAQQTTWYQPHSHSFHWQGSAGFRVYPYIGQKLGQKWMRLRADLTREDWVFVESLTILVDGQTVEIPLSRYKDVDTDVGGGQIYEYVDLSSQDVLIRKIAGAKEVHFSFEGRHRRVNYKLSKSDVDFFKTTINIFDRL